MKHVFKYVLQATEKQVIDIPSDKILSSESQREDIIVYALVDADIVFSAKYEFRVYGTGHDIPDDIGHFTFLNTVKLQNDSLVFHVFYRRIV